MCIHSLSAHAFNAMKTFISINRNSLLKILLYLSPMSMYSGAHIPTLYSLASYRKCKYCTYLVKIYNVSDVFSTSEPRFVCSFSHLWNSLHQFNVGNVFKLLENEATVQPLTLVEETQDTYQCFEHLHCLRIYFNAFFYFFLQLRFLNRNMQLKKNQTRQGVFKGVWSYIRNVVVSSFSLFLLKPD